MRKSFILFLIFLLLFMTGCINVPSQINGPKWTNNSTLPLVIRAKNSDGSSYNELRLDGQNNAHGDKGVDLTGNGSTVYAPGGDIQIECGEYGVKEIAGFNVLNSFVFPGGVIPNSEITATIPVGLINLTDYYAFKTSADTTDGMGGDLNTFIITINGGTITNLEVTLISVNAGTTINQTFTSGSVAKVPIPNFDLAKGMTIRLNGTYTAGASVSIDFSNLAISYLSFKGSVIDTYKTFLPVASIAPINFDMASITSGNINVKSCVLTFRAPTLPQNLKTTTSLKVIKHYNNNSETETDYVLIYSNTTIPDPITLSFEPGISYIRFVVSSITLAAEDPNQTTIIDTTQLLQCAIHPQVTLQSNIQEIAAGKVDQSIQNVGLSISVKNNTLSSFEVNLYLSPESAPMSDPDAIKFNFIINPADVAGELKETVINDLNLTAADFDYLTSGNNIYNQLEFIDRSQGKVQTDPVPYLEIRSSASIQLLINDK